MDDASRGERPPVGPRYCPRCGGQGIGDGPLCRDCGDTLRGRGYCPICEVFWKLGAGSNCPKHEVALLDEAPPARSFGVPGERTSLVTVATYTHPNLANAPRIRLEAEGIPTFLDGERIAGSTPYQLATGGVRLQVPAPLESAARILIAQTWTVAPETGDDTEDAWEDLAPEPGLRRRAIMKLAILIFLFGPGLIAVVSALIRWADGVAP
jgi:hypothetical protein